MIDLLVNFLNIFDGLNKTIIMFMILVISCVFRVKGYISGDNWEGVIKAVTVSYFGTHMVEHYTSMIKERLLANGKKEEVTEIDAKEEG
jgi:hypothetical protein